MTFAACVGSPLTASMLMPPHRIAASARPNASKSRRAKPPLLPPRLVPPPHHAHATRPNRPRRSCVPSPPRQSPRQNLHSARGTASAPITRFRALALFGRRPQERVDRPSSRRPKTCTKPVSRAAKKIGRPSRAINEVAGTSLATRCAGVRPQFTGVPSGARLMISILVPQGSVM